MKKLLFYLIAFYALSGFSQKRSDCNELLSREVIYTDRLGFWQEFNELKGCGIDSIDINVFGKASYLNFIYNKFEARNTKVYFRDLLREVQAIKKTHDYLNVRSIEVKDQEFLKKTASRSTWNEDRKYLEKRGYSENELKKMYEFIGKDDKNLTYESLIFEFQQTTSR